MDEQHNADYVLAAGTGVFLYHQPHILHPPAMFLAGRYDIYSCGVDAAVAKDVGELGDIFLDAVKRTGKKVSEVMRKYFAWIDVCVPQSFFISRHMFVQLMGLPVLVTKITPLWICWCCAYFISFFCRLLTIITVLDLPLQLTFA